MRPLWTGTLSFGLVNIPVRLFTAVQSKERVSFRLLHKEDLSPVRYERVCAEDGEVVPWDDIVKGYEYSKGKFIALSENDFKSAAIESSKAIDILDFVKAEEIDPRYFETPYYLVPQKGGEKAYALLREAIKRGGVVGIGKITMRTNNLHLAGIKTVGDAIVLDVMRFANELVDTDAMEFPSDSGLRPQELQMAEQLIENLSAKFDPTKYVDDYRANLMKIIRAKLKGKKIEAPKPEARESTEVIDLMARLQESLQAAKGGAGRAASGHAHRAHHAKHPAKKTRARTHRTHRAKRATRQSA